MTTTLDWRNVANIFLRFHLSFQATFQQFCTFFEVHYPFLRIICPWLELVSDFRIHGPNNQTVHQKLSYSLSGLQDVLMYFQIILSFFAQRTVSLEFYHARTTWSRYMVVYACTSDFDVDVELHLGVRGWPIKNHCSFSLQCPRLFSRAADHDLGFRHARCRILLRPYQWIQIVLCSRALFLHATTGRSTTYDMWVSRLTQVTSIITPYF